MSPDIFDVFQNIRDLFVGLDIVEIFPQLFFQYDIGAGFRYGGAASAELSLRGDFRLVFSEELAETLGVFATPDT